MIFETITAFLFLAASVALSGAARAALAGGNMCLEIAKALTRSSEAANRRA